MSIEAPEKVAEGAAEKVADEDLLPDDLHPKKNARPLVRSTKQARRAAEAAARKAEEEALANQQSAADAAAARLAQIVNLHIAGYSLAQIGAQIGASADEVDRMLASDAARYVRSQPALRVYVRNWVSERYTKMLDAVWDDATDKNSPARLESQDRALRILDKMTRLHGAEAPTQTEVKVEHAPEAVERLVSALAAQSGMGYDTSVFDVVDAEVVHEAVEQSHDATQVSGNEVGKPQPGDKNWEG